MIRLYTSTGYSKPHTSSRQRPLCSRNSTGHCWRNFSTNERHDISRLLNQDFTCLEPDDSKQSVEDRRFVDTLETCIKRTSDGHLQMPLPCKSQNPTMPDNKEVAVRRLMLLKKKLQRDKQYYTDYTSFMNDIINHG